MAGSHPNRVHPKAISIMKEIKIDISDQFSKTINELEDKDFEYVFTLCSDAEENCPVLFKGKTIHIGFEDPPKLTEDIDDDIKKLNIYRKVRDEILDFILNISNYI